MKRIGVALLFASVALAQTPKTGTIEGRVFSISQVGDLLPARMAKGLVFSCENAKGISPEEETASVCSYLWDKESQRHHSCPDWYTPQRCDRESRVQALKDALRWAKEHNVSVMDFVADEEGRFRITKVPWGASMVYVTGQAGIEQCIWQELTNVKPNAVATVKLSKPEFHQVPN